MAPADNSSKKLSKNQSKSDRRGYVDPAAEQVAAVYAKALVGAAQSAGVTETVLAELDSLITDVLDAFPKLESVFQSELVSPEDKASIIDRTLGGRASPTLINTLKVLARHGRLGALRDIRRQAHDLYAQIRGLISVEVTTAVPLDAPHAHAIRDQLRAMIGGEPVLSEVINPDLIGGLVLRVGDTVYDGSVATRLSRVRTQMINRSVHEIQRRRDRFGNTTGN